MKLSYLNETKSRLDKFLAKAEKITSRAEAQKLIKAQKVKVNSKLITDPAKKITQGDLIQFEILPDEEYHFKPIKRDLNIIYEDKEIIVVAKPAGVITHPGAGNKTETLLHYLLAHTALAPSDDYIRPGVVHRLDKDTSGLIVLAKTKLALLNLQSQFALKTAGRKYLALSWGSPLKAAGEINQPIGRSKFNRQKMAITSQGKPAITQWELLGGLKSLSVLKCSLKTGRTHQIRVHLTSIGLPIVADKTYSTKHTKLIANLSDKLQNIISSYPHQFLHAYELNILHPVTAKKLTFHLKPEQEFMNIISYLNLDLTNLFA